jgi:hypothetical protein
VASTDDARRLPNVFLPYCGVLLDPPWRSGVEASGGGVAAFAAELATKIPYRGVVPHGIVFLWTPRRYLAIVMAEWGRRPEFRFVEYVAVVNADGLYAGTGAAVHEEVLMVFKHSEDGHKRLRGAVAAATKWMSNIVLNTQRNCDVVTLGTGNHVGGSSRAAVIPLVETLIPAGSLLELWGTPGPAAAEQGPVRSRWTIVREM